MHIHYILDNAVFFLVLLTLLIDCSVLTLIDSDCFFGDRASDDNLLSILSIIPLLSSINGVVLFIQQCNVDVMYDVI